MTAVKLIAHTAIDPFALAELGYLAHGYEPEDMHEGIAETDIDELHEFSGRNCYRSFARPNPKTAANADYLAHVIDNAHESVLEHGSATFYINASRSVLTELTRHRHLSFSVVSQRYVDVEKLTYHVPPAINDALDNGELDEQDKADLWDALVDAKTEALIAYRTIVGILERNGNPRKQAREAARAVIPNMTDSPMVVTGNIRAWKHVLRMRWHEAADAEIRELAGLILAELRGIAPNSVSDIPDEPFK